MQNKFLAAKFWLMYSSLSHTNTHIHTFSVTHNNTHIHTFSVTHKNTHIHNSTHKKTALFLWSIETFPYFILHSIKRRSASNVFKPRSLNKNCFVKIALHWYKKYWAWMLSWNWELCTFTIYTLDLKSRLFTYSFLKLILISSLNVQDIFKALYNFNNKKKQLHEMAIFTNAKNSGRKFKLALIYVLQSGVNFTNSRPTIKIIFIRKTV